MLKTDFLFCPVDLFPLDIIHIYFTFYRFKHRNCMLKVLVVWSWGGLGVVGESFYHRMSLKVRGVTLPAIPHRSSHWCWSGCRFLMVHLKISPHLITRILKNWGRVCLTPVALTNQLATSQRASTSPFANVPHQKCNKRHMQKHGTPSLNFLPFWATAPTFQWTFKFCIYLHVCAVTHSVTYLQTVSSQQWLYISDYIGEVKVRWGNTFINMDKQWK